jgi:hypothetical protein
MQCSSSASLAGVAVASGWILLAIASVASAGGDRQTPVELVLALNESRALPQSPLSLTFEAVVEDSRCPTGTECIWEGNAAVRVRLDERGKTSVTHIVNTSSRFPQSFEHGDVRVRLVKVEPYPGYDAPVCSEDYRITVAISRK